MAHPTPVSISRVSAAGKTGPSGLGNGMSLNDWVGRCQASIRRL